MKKLFLILIPILILFSCKKENTTPPNPQPNPPLPSGNEVITLDNEGMSNIVSYSNAGKINFTNPVGYEVGDILTSLEISEEVPNGFLRKITSISSDKKTIQTTQVTIEESTEEGLLHVNLELLSGEKSKWDLEPGIEFTSEKKGFEFGFDFNNYILYDKDGNLSTNDDQIGINGFINFNYEVEIKIEVKNWEMKEFTFNNIFDENLELGVTSSLGTGSINKEKRIASYSFPPYLLGFVGVIPVWITLRLDIIIGSNGTVSICTTTVSNSLHAEAGVKYENSNWNLISDLSNNFSFESPLLNSNLNMTTYAGPELNILIYDVAGPNTFAKSYLNLNAHNKTIYWYLNGGLDVFAGIKVHALSKTWIDKNYEIINFEKELTSGQFGVNIPTANFMANPKNVLVGESIQFIDLSSHNPNQWEWDFGDGTYSTIQAPIKSYSSPGDYTITLCVSNEGGEDCETRTNYVHVEGEVNTVTIQPDPSTSKDVEIGKFLFPDGSEQYWSAPDKEKMEVDWEDNISNGVWSEVLIEFPLIEIPSNATIISTTLQIYCANAGDGTGLKIYKNLSSWEENYVTWPNKPEKEIIGVMETSFGYNWEEFDITEQIQEWITQNNNYGFTFVSNSNDQMIYIYSSHHPDQSKRPKLIIEYN
jgi:PKD repeat protein